MLCYDIFVTLTIYPKKGTARDKWGSFLKTNPTNLCQYPATEPRILASLNLSGETNSWDVEPVLACENIVCKMVLFCVKLNVTICIIFPYILPFAKITFVKKH